MRYVNCWRAESDLSTCQADAPRIDWACLTSLSNQLTGRQLFDQGYGLTRPDRHERGARFLARQLPKRADEAPLQRELQGLAVGHLGNEPVTQCAGWAAGKGARQLGPVVDGAAQLRAVQRETVASGHPRKAVPS